WVGRLPLRQDRHQRLVVGVAARIEVGESADHDVAGRPGPDRVVAPTADEDALAAAAGDRVDARAPDEDVAQRVARQRVAAAAAADVLDVGDPAGGAGGGAGRKVRRDGGGVQRVVQPVAARPAVDGILEDFGA